LPFCQLSKILPNLLSLTYAISFRSSEAVFLVVCDPSKNEL